MGRTWTGVGLMAGGAVLALTGTECQVTGSFQTYSVSDPFGASVNLGGRDPVLNPSTCALEDFTISGTVLIQPITVMASEYNRNSAQRDIRTYIEANVQGEKTRKPAMLYGGLAMIGVGALVATVWADAPDVQMDLQRGVVRLNKTIGW